MDPEQLQADADNEQHQQGQIAHLKNRIFDRGQNRVSDGNAVTRVVSRYACPDRVCGDISLNLISVKAPLNRAIMPMTVWNQPSRVISGTQNHPVAFGGDPFTASALADCSP